MLLSRPIEPRAAPSHLALWSLFLLALSGCATYHPAPLADAPDLAPGTGAISIDPARLALPPLKAHAFDPRNGLDMTETAMVAVANNPTLKAVRLKAGIAAAQLLAARLLPDPVVAPSLTRPVKCSTVQCEGGGLTTGYGLGLSYDVLSLITRQARVSGAAAGARQVRLDILWQEWQTAQQARTLYSQAVSQSRRLNLLRGLQRLYAQRYHASSKALRQGNVTLDVVSTDLTGLLQANTQVNLAEQQENKLRHDLYGLLGLAPNVALNLGDLPAPTAPAIDSGMLATLAQRRPDLLALQAGYASQEAAVRAAILSQFPSISVGVNGGRDTGGLTSVGFDVSLSLPVFNRNRGQIALQRATRDRLRQEFTARLDATRVRIDMLENQYRIITRQLRLVDRNIPLLQGMVHRARIAYQGGNIDSLLYLNMQFALINKKLERIDLQQTLWETRIALDTLAGWTRWE